MQIAVAAPGTSRRPITGAFTAGDTGGGLDRRHRARLRRRSTAWRLGPAPGRLPLPSRTSPAASPLLLPPDRPSGPAAAWRLDNDTPGTPCEGERGRRGVNIPPVRRRCAPMPWTSPTSGTRTGSFAWVDAATSCGHLRIRITPRRHPDQPSRPIRPARPCGVVDDLILRPVRWRTGGWGEWGGQESLFQPVVWTRATPAEENPGPLLP